MTGSIRTTLTMLATVAAAAACLPFAASAQQRAPAAAPAIHAKPTKTLVVRNAMVIYGNAKPPYGPMDIVADNGIITSITPSGDRSRSVVSTGVTVIDAAGKY